MTLQQVGSTAVNELILGLLLLTYTFLLPSAFYLSCLVLPYIYFLSLLGDDVSLFSRHEFGSFVVGGINCMMLYMELALVALWEFLSLYDDNGNNNT
jgi:hypothetical protein